MSEPLTPETHTSVLPESEPVLQFSILLDNRAGAFVSLLHLLKRGGIEVLGISVQDSSDATIARLILSDPESAQPLLIERGIAHTTCELVVLGFLDTATELPASLETLRNAEVNVDFSYSLFPHPDGRTLIAFHLDDPYFCLNLLNQSGFKTYYQKDLSR